MVIRNAAFLAIGAQQGHGQFDPLAVGKLDTLLGDGLVFYKFLTKLRNGIKQTIACMGTELTELASGLTLHPYPTQLEDWLKQLANESSDVVILNHGANGEASDYGVATELPLVLATDFDVVFIEYSINDALTAKSISLAQSAANLNTIIDGLIAGNSDVEIILMTMSKPVGSQVTGRPDFVDYYQVYRDVASDRKFLLIDNYVTWDDLEVNDNDTWVAYDFDDLNPDPIGNLNVTIANIKQGLGEMGFDPDDFGNTVLWYDGTNVKTQFTNTAGTTQVKTDGDVFARHNTAKGIGNAQQGTASAQPSYQSDTASQVNGLPIIKYDGSDFLDTGVLQLGSTRLIAVASDAFTIFVQGAFDAGGTFISKAVINGDNRTLQIFETGGVLSVNMRGSNNSIGTGYVAGDPVLITIIWDGTIGKAYVNDGNEFILAIGGTFEDSNQTIVLGARSTFAIPAFFLDGDLNEVIIFDEALSDTDRKAVANEIMFKRGIINDIFPIVSRGLQAWIDPNDLSTIQDTGGLVDQINDKSGNSNNPTATGTARPSTETRSINGHNVLDFDGVDNFLDFGTTTFGDTTLDAVAGKEFSIQCVFQADGNGVLFARADSSPTSNKLLEASITGVNASITSKGTSTTFQDAPANEPLLLSLYWDGSILTGAVNNDAVEVAAVGSLVDLLAENFLLGARAGGGSANLDCAIGDFVLYDVYLDTAEKLQNVDFFMNKYALSPLFARSMGSLGLQLWTDTSIASTITSSGGKVSQHDDRRGVAVNWTSSGGDRPNTDVDTINGLNAFGFNNAGTDFMTLGAETLGNTGLFCDPGESFTVHIVCSINDEGTVISRCSDTEADRTFQIFQEGGFLKVNLRGSITSIASYVLSTEVLITITWDGTDALAYINLGSAIALSVGTASEETGEEMILGAHNAGQSNNADCLIAEVGIIDQVQLTVRRVATIAYLAGKWIQ